MADGVDRLDAVGRREVRAEEADRRRPVGGVRRRVRARLHEARGERGQVPGHREREREESNGKRPPAAQRKRQDRDRDRRVSKPGDVLAEARRNEVRGGAGDEVDDVHPRSTAGRCHAPGERRSRGRRTRTRPRTRAARTGNGRRRGRDAAARARPPSRARASSSGSTSPERPGARESPIPARMTASRTKATGLAASTSTVSSAKCPRRPGLQGPQREQRERHAERERERAGEHDACPHDGEGAVRPARRRPPLTRRDDPERERRRRDARNREQLDPEQRRERVVEKAVGDEAVAAGVPEVVPDPEPVILEQAALVEVRGEVAPRRAEPRERGGERRCNACGRKGLERDPARGAGDLRRCRRCHRASLILRPGVPGAGASSDDAARSG